MNWIKVNENTKAPAEEVLAISKHSNLLIGTLVNQDGGWICLDKEDIHDMPNVVGYIPTRELAYAFTHNGGL
jgi:hypothetical protein